jgi:hypothetical protein
MLYMPIKSKKDNFMSNTEASEDNIESPSTYGNEAYKGYRKEKKEKQKEESDGINSSGI